MQIDDNNTSVKSTKYYLHVFLLFIYVLITPLSMVRIPGIGSVMKIMSIFIFIICITLLFIENVTVKINNRLVNAWTAYVLYTSLSILWSTNFESSLPIAVGLLQVLLISVVLTKFELCEEDIGIIESAWIIVSLICLLLFFGGAGRQIEYGGRISIVLSSGGSDPNEFCAYFYLPLSIAVARLFRNKTKLINAMYIIYIVAIFYCIFLTGSRGGLLAAIAGVAVSWMFSTSMSLKKIVLMLFLLVSLYIVFLYFFIPNLPQTVLERLQPASMIEDKGSNRIIIWKTALSNISSGTSRLFYGYGPYGVTFMGNTMHNQFVQALMDGGIIGLILYMNFFVELLKKAYRNGAIIFGGVTGAFVSLTTLTAYAFFKPIWVIFLMCLITVKKREAISKQKII